MPNRTWEHEVDNVHLFFEELTTTDNPTYLFSCLAKKDDNHIACSVFDDAIVFNQIGATTGYDDKQFSDIIELFAILTATVNSTRIT